jgi:hypothetical protein
MKKLQSIIAIFTISLSCYNLNAQLKIHSDGNVFIGGDQHDWSRKLTINSINQSSLFIYSNFTTEWQHSSDTYVDRNYTVCHAVLLNGNITYYVVGTGAVWSQVGYSTGSDISLKRDINPIQSPLNKVLNLKGITYKLKNESSLKSSDPEYDKIHLGFVAQDVEKIVPEVVSTMQDGLKGIDYSKLVPLLVEAIKEQQVQIEKLEQEVENLSSTSEANKIFNYPNPFTNETTINMVVPSDAHHAYLNIYSSKGDLIKTIDIIDRGNLKIEFNASNLASGTYTFTLFADDKNISSNRMIIR